MILYTLRCRKDHLFEAWFRDSGSYEQLSAAGEVRCPKCGSKKVEKALMAPSVAAGRDRGQPKTPPANLAANRAANPAANGAPVPAPASGDKASEARKVLLELRKQIENNFDYVGPQFAEEARKIHYGEIEQRAIYGETSQEDAQALNDEGIDVKQIPWVPRGDA